MPGRLCALSGHQSESRHLRAVASLRNGRWSAQSRTSTTVSVTVSVYTLAIDLEGAALRVVGCAPMPGAGLGSSMQRVEGETVETWVGTEGSTTHVVVRRPELELHVMGDVSFRRAIQLGLATEFLF